MSLPSHSHMSEGRNDAHGEMTAGGRQFTSVEDLPSGHTAPPGLVQFHWDDGLRDPLTQASHNKGEPIELESSVIKSIKFCAGRSILCPQSHIEGGWGSSQKCIKRSRLTALLWGFNVYQQLAVGGRPLYWAVCNMLSTNSAHLRRTARHRHR